MNCRPLPLLHLNICLIPNVPRLILSSFDFQLSRQVTGSGCLRPLGKSHEVSNPSCMSLDHPVIQFNCDFQSAPCDVTAACRANCGIFGPAEKSSFPRSAKFVSARKTLRTDAHKNYALTFAVIFMPCIFHFPLSKSSNLRRIEL